MVKKAQGISLFVIIGILIVLSFGLLISLSLRKNTRDFRTDVDKSIDFANARENVEIYIEQCLQKKTIEAITDYGLESESDIERQISDNVLKCLDEISFLDGLEVEYKRPVANVDITEDVVHVNLDFPIEITYQLDTISFKDFSYTLRTVASVPTHNGVLKAGSTIFSEDENFVLLAEQDSSVTDEDGNPVDLVSVRMVDRNFDDLDNNVVLGEIVYDGLDGVRFDPPVTVKIRLNKEDLPNKNREFCLAT